MRLTRGTRRRTQSQNAKSSVVCPALEAPIEAGRSCERSRQLIQACTSTGTQATEGGPAEGDRLGANELHSPPTRQAFPRRPWLVATPDGRVGDLKYKLCNAALSQPITESDVVFLTQAKVKDTIMLIQAIACRETTSTS